MVNNAVSIVVKNAALIGVVGENLVINHTTSQGKLHISKKFIPKSFLFFVFLKPRPLVRL